MSRDAFIARKQNGLSLSDRVWRYTEGFKTEMEMGLDLGIRAGKSADHERWQNLNFVVDIEIHLSGNHTCKGRDGKPH